MIQHVPNAIKVQVSIKFQFDLILILLKIWVIHACISQDEKHKFWGGKWPPGNLCFNNDDGTSI